MIIKLCDTNVDIYNAFNTMLAESKAHMRHLSQLQCQITTHNQSFTTMCADALASPANSFMIMDGGIDAIISEFYRQSSGVNVQGQLQVETSTGFIPIGTAVSTLTIKEQYPHLICAPTMHTPMDISTTCNAYIATRAAIREAYRVGVDSVLLVGMGGLTGGYAPTQVARQMFCAIYDELAVDYGTCPNWDDVKDLYDDLLIEL